MEKNKDIWSPDAEAVGDDIRHGEEMSQRFVQIVENIKDLDDEWLKEVKKEVEKLLVERKKAS